MNDAINLVDDTCCVCGKPFTDEEWSERHSHPVGGLDCHDTCCPMCKPKRTRNRTHEHNHN